MISNMNRLHKLLDRLTPGYKTRQEIDRIITEEYNNYEGSVYTRFWNQHFIFRTLHGDRAFLRHLKYLREINPRPSYPFEDYGPWKTRIRKDWSVDLSKIPTPAPLPPMALFIDPEVRQGLSDALTTAQKVVEQLLQAANARRMEKKVRRDTAAVVAMIQPDPRMELYARDIELIRQRFWGGIIHRTMREPRIVHHIDFELDAIIPVQPLPAFYDAPKSKAIELDELHMFPPGFFDSSDLGHFSGTEYDMLLSGLWPKGKGFAGNMPGRFYYGKPAGYDPRLLPVPYLADYFDCIVGFIAALYVSEIGNNHTPDGSDPWSWHPHETI
jgi:hypothetical protein